MLSESLVTTAWRVLHATDRGERLQIRRTAVNILHKQSLIVDKGWSNSLGIGGA